MHTAITPGVLSAPWEPARWHRPRPLGTTVHVRQSHQQGAKTGSARTPACSLDTAEMEDTQDICRGNRGPAGGHLYRLHHWPWAKRAPPPPASCSTGGGRQGARPAAGGQCRCDPPATMTHPPPSLAAHLPRPLSAQVCPRRGTSSPGTLGPRIPRLKVKGGVLHSPDRGFQRPHYSVFGSHHDHVIPLHPPPQGPGRCVGSTQSPGRPCNVQRRATRSRHASPQVTFTWLGSPGALPAPGLRPHSRWA